MCFSASVSFSVATLLASSGIWTAKEHWFSKGRALSLIPLMFASQQFLEGLAWRHFDHFLEPPQKFIAFFYLFLALVIWPSYFSLSVFYMENQQKRKTYLQYLIFIGFFFSCSNFYHLVFFPISIERFDCSLLYHYESLPQGIFYAGLVCGPFILSSKPKMAYLGIFGLIALWITNYLQVVTFVSVWCFFAACISSFIHVILRLNHFHERDLSLVNG